MLRNYQEDFIKFLLQSEALLFGEFTLKSGRKAPYFINSAKFDNGELITELGRFYAAHIINSNIGNFDNIFGPAYKGIPLAVTTSMALFDRHRVKCGYSFDRKESKQHGDGGKIVGRPLRPGDRLVIVEDVITAGTTLSAIVPELRSAAGVEIAAVILSVDRQEKGTGSRSAASELEEKLGIKILPIVTISEIITFLSSENSGSLKLTPDLLEKIKKYRHEYGA